MVAQLLILFVLFVTSDDHSHLQLEHIIEGFENPLSVPDKPAWATVLELVPTWAECPGPRLMQGLEVFITSEASPSPCAPVRGDPVFIGSLQWDPNKEVPILSRS